MECGGLLLRGEAATRVAAANDPVVDAVVKHFFIVGTALGTGTALLHAELTQTIACLERLHANGHISVDAIEVLARSFVTAKKAICQIVKNAADPLTYGLAPTQLGCRFRSPISYLG